MRMAESDEEIGASHVLTLEEITSLTEEEGKPADTLMNVVALIASRFNTDVCSAYLLEPDRSNLVLAASLGLHPRCIGTLRMPLSEGLAGLVAEKVLPVAVNDVQSHPRYKYFKESGEEIYHSFLGVPLIDSGMLQGVLLFRRRIPGSFRRTRFACWWRRQTRSLPWSARLVLWIDSSLPSRNASGPSPGIYGGAGTTTASACFAISIQSAGAS